MTEQPPDPETEEDPDPGTPERVRTDVAEVDEVIRAVEELEERPIEEHVGVFEAAHQRLRQALDHSTQDQTPANTPDNTPDDT